MQPQQIRFSAHPGTFQVRTLRCNHVECPCTNVSFALIELPDGNRHFKPPARINIRVDVPTWQEVDPPDRSAQEAAVVAEFLRDYPPAERQELQAYFDDRRTINRRLKEGRISLGKIEDQELVEFRDVLRPADDLPWDCRLGEYIVECEGADYIVIERYCPNPACPCRVVVVSFLRREFQSDGAGPKRAEEQFAALRSLDGSVAVKEVYRGSRSEAEAVMAAWQEEYGDDVAGLRWRYDKIKEIARRSWRPGRRLPEPPEPREPLASASRRVGRNDPCPCGSGKKYKKCCGPAAKQDVSSESP